MITINLGIAGLGTVSQGLIEILREEGPYLEKKLGLRFEIQHVVDRSFAKIEKQKILEDIPASDKIEDILDNPKIDVFVELIGGLNPAYDWLKKALSKKKSVVTANKYLLAEKGEELFGLAHKIQSPICFEAAIGGTIPIIQTMQQTLAPNKIDAVYAILNGTSNYIISRMRESSGGEGVYEKALKQAQNEGYSEVDPSLDVNGFDAAQKLSILASLAFRKRIVFQKEWINGISRLRKIHFDIANSEGLQIVPVAIAKRKPAEFFVGPALVAKKIFLPLL